MYAVYVLYTLKHNQNQCIWMYVRGIKTVSQAFGFPGHNTHDVHPQVENDNCSPVYPRAWILFLAKQKVSLSWNLVDEGNSISTKLFVVIFVSII
jgi:hypothetical protein